MKPAIQPKVDTSESADPVRPDLTQRVHMSRAELALYIREGRPTGLLLSSVALLKGISTEALAKAAGVPVALVQSMFATNGLTPLKAGTIRRVATVLGIDLSTMRLAAGQVHVFTLSHAPGFGSSARARAVVGAVGLLARDARVAEVQVGRGIKAALTGSRVYVAQNASFRALFVASPLARFELDRIPSASWVRGSRPESVVRIASGELVANLGARDLTESEFDEMFMGADAFSWEDIRVAARSNGVSKAELMDFIRLRADQADEAEGAETKSGVDSRPAFLRLVETELKVAVG